MIIQIISLFPEMFEGVLGSSMLWKAQKNKIVEYKLINLRDFGIGPRKQVDDIPYGGGDGMVLKPEPLFAAVEFAKTQTPEAEVILMTPRGSMFNQAYARRIVKDAKDIIIICGRYEGYDERVVSMVDQQISIGEFVLTGGELPAMVVIDSIVRLLPGVLGGERSAELESYSINTEKEHPHYTRPADYKGLKVPEVLLSGKHSDIEQWRSTNSL